MFHITMAISLLTYPNKCRNPTLQSHISVNSVSFASGSNVATQPYTLSTEPGSIGLSVQSLYKNFANKLPCTKRIVIHTKLAAPARTSFANVIWAPEALVTASISLIP